jgi:hypothetical protein
MADDTKQTLDHPPFPPLRWREYFWTGRAVLSSWAGFQSRLGAYASTSSSAVSDGTVRLSVAAADSSSVPAAEQAAAYEYLLANQPAIRDTVVAAIFEEYPLIRQNVLGGGIVDPADMPELGTPDGLKSCVGLAVVHILSTVKDGVAYTGFEFGCNWDDEHGLGVMLHLGRIVEFPENGVGKVNGADLASEEWLAEEDANSVA